MVRDGLKINIVPVPLSVFVNLIVISELLVGTLNVCVFRTQGLWIGILVEIIVSLPKSSM